MRLITELFKNRQEKSQINNMLIIAAHENLLGKTDIDLLTKNVNFLSYRELSDDNQIESIKKALPSETKDKFKVVYLLLNSLMTNGTLSDNKEQVVTNLIQVMNVPREKAGELVQYLKSNILNGLSFEDAFLRLGYLLESPKYA